MKIWFISDTHGKHHKLQIPTNVDMVIHCGDESNFRDPHMNLAEATNFFQWYNNINIKYKIFVPGNHSIAVERKLVVPGEYSNIQFLMHEETVIEGIRIFGSPYTPTFGDWSFMKARHNIGRTWATLPNRCDILVTHGPPKGILDLTRNFTNKLEQAGDSSLLKKVEEICPVYHAFGHFHDEKGINNFGLYTRDITTFINCSVSKHNSEEINQGIIVGI